MSRVQQQQQLASSTTTSLLLASLSFVVGCAFSTAVTCSLMNHYYSTKLAEYDDNDNNDDDEDDDDDDNDDDDSEDNDESNKNNNNTKRNISNMQDTTIISTNKKKLLDLPESIRQEQLSRHILYFGEKNMKLIQNCKICIVGVGGVGSHVANMLVRGGVQYIRLIDFDYVTVSSLNRNAIATIHDVGTPKVTCIKNYLINNICPNPNYLHIETFIEMYTKESGDRLLQINNTTNESPLYNWDMVIDCIDDIPTKTQLLYNCLCKNIKVISCMGAGCKGDFTRLHWSDLRSSSKDPLASKLRQSLRQLIDSNTNTTKSTTTTEITKHPTSVTNKATEGNVNTKTTTTTPKRKTTTESSKRNGRVYNDYLDDMDKLSIVYSSEKTVIKLADFTDEQKQEMNLNSTTKDKNNITTGTSDNTTTTSNTTTTTTTNNIQQYGTIDNMRIRIVPVLGTMPAIFGQALATICLTSIGQKPIHPVPGERISRTVRNRLYQHLKSREIKLYNTLYEKHTTTTSSDIKNNINNNSIKELDNDDGGILINNTIYINKTNMYIDQDDVEYILEIYKNRCCISGDRVGTVLELVRYNLSLPTIVSNLIVVSSNTINKYFNSTDTDFIVTNTATTTPKNLAAPFSSSSSSSSREVGVLVPLTTTKAFITDIDISIRKQIESRLESCCI